MVAPENSRDSAVDAALFASLMMPLGPFGPAPVIAAGVSGGADSLALALLLDEWTKAAGGKLLAIVVDHGLREASAAEANQVVADLGSRGIEAVALRLNGPFPTSAVQNWARRERFVALETLCRRRGIFHLALAHRLEDQGETLLMRLARGSGPSGLAGIAAVRDTQWLRVLRPLLTISRARLEATCRQQGAGWVEDPSNLSRAFARGRLREASQSLASEGLGAISLGMAAGRAGAWRRLMDGVVARLMAASARIEPSGWVELDPSPLVAIDPPALTEMLARLLAMVGGNDRPIREQCLVRLARIIVGGLQTTVTLAGCCIVPRRSRVLMIRELAVVEPPRCLIPGLSVLWDGRFELRINCTNGSGQYRVMALAHAGTGQAKRGIQTLAGHHWPGVPVSARATLPVVLDAGMNVIFPSIMGLLSEGQAAYPAVCRAEAWFVPTQAATAGPFQPAGGVV